MSAEGLPERSARPGWLPDEVAGAGRENLDPDHVDRYDGKMDSAGAAEVALVQAPGLSDRSVVVDLGAGTGQFTVAAAAVAGRVVAVDVSPAMLARLEQRVRASGWANVEIVRAGFLTYEHAGAAPWCATGGDGVEGEWSRAEPEEHVRDEHSTFTCLLEPMAERAGFRIEQAWYSDDGMEAAYVLRAVEEHP